MVDTEGRHLLAAWFVKTGTSRAAFGKQLDVSGPAVSNWLSGHSRPETHYRVAIETITGTPVSSWFTPEEAATAAVRPDESHDDLPAIASTGTGES